MVIFFERMFVDNVLLCLLYTLLDAKKAHNFRGLTGL